MSSYLYLTLAILSEVVATTALKSVAGFSRPVPLLLVVIGYAASFWLMSIVMRSLPVGVTYAIWAGMGLVLISLSSFFVYQQKLDAPAILGMGLILAGVVVIQLFSRSSGH